MKNTVEQALGANRMHAGQAGPLLTAQYFYQLLNVSRETFEILTAFDTLFMEYAQQHNLVARSTLSVRWQRHYFDSAQLMPLLPPRAETLVDFGSGAGFPGLILAILAQDPVFSARRLSPLKVILIESTGKKAAFLAATAEALGLPHVVVENDRIELVAKRAIKADVITARALASLDVLLAMSMPFMTNLSTLLFLKGAQAQAEIDVARKSWRFSSTGHASMTDEHAQIIEITQLARRTIKGKN